MLIRNPRLRKVADRVSLGVTVALACLTTYQSLPDPGKSWRPLLVAQIIVAWVAVAVAFWVAQRNRRKRALLPLPEVR